MRLTPAQRRVVDLPPQPARVTGGFGSGRTSALAARAVRWAAAGEPVLAVCRTTAAARRFEAVAQEAPGLTTTTFVDLALDVVHRHDGPVGLVDGEGQRRIVGILLEDGWPEAGIDATDPLFIAEVASMVCHYQASFLGAEELRVHADAAGELDRWDALASFTDAYVAELRELKVVDWAGALVRAAMLLRDPAVAAAERERAPHVVVDDFEAASFATARLLTLLCGRLHDVVVAGNPGARLDDAHGGSPSYLERLPRRFDITAERDVRLDDRLRPTLAPHPRVCPPAEEVGTAVDAVHVGGAVLVPDDDVTLVSALSAAVPSGVEVVRVDDASSREWPHVVVTGVVAGRFPAPRPRTHWFDRHLLGGPDVPDDDERDAKWHEHERSRYELATSRATESLTLVVPTG